MFMKNKYLAILIVYQIFIQYSKASTYGQETDQQCEKPECPRGEHNYGCGCRSNTWMCEIFDETELSCTQCKQQDFYALNIDESQGNYCSAKGWWIALLVVGIFFLFAYFCCVCCRQTIIKCCCQDHQGCCYKSQRCTCLCHEQVQKLCCCYSADKGTPCCCYSYCFTSGFAIEPFAVIQPKSQWSPDYSVQGQLNENQQMPEGNYPNFANGIKQPRNLAPIPMQYRNGFTDPAQKSAPSFGDNLLSNNNTGSYNPPIDTAYSPDPNIVTYPIQDSADVNAKTTSNKIFLED